MYKINCHGTTTLSEILCYFSKVSALTVEAELPPEAAEQGRPTLGISVSSHLSHYSSILQLCSDHEGCLTDKFTAIAFLSD